MAKLSAVEKAQVKKMFDDLDADKDGKINKAEMGSLISGMNQTAEEAMFKFIDKDGNQTIDFDEFVKFYEGNFQVPTDVMMKAFFQSYDKNGDGFLSKAELKEAMIKMGAPVGGAYVDEMLAEIDANKDGKISYEEYIKVMKD